MPENISEAILTTVQAQQAVKRAEEAHNALVARQSAERNALSTFFDKYQGIMTFYNQTYQSYLEGAQLNRNFTESICELLLMDPPYDIRFVAKSNQRSLAQLIHLSVKNGGTAAIYCDWTQASAWKSIFKKQPEANGNWFVQGLIPVHKHQHFAYRTAQFGHKSMTEYVFLAHKKDSLATGQLLQQGKKGVNINELEAVLGTSPTGNWKHDFLIDQTPPPRDWRLRYDSGVKSGTAVRPNAEKSSSALAQWILRYSGIINLRKYYE